MAVVGMSVRSVSVCGVCGVHCVFYVWCGCVCYEKCSWVVLDVGRRGYYWLPGFTVATRSTTSPPLLTII